MSIDCTSTPSCLVAASHSLPAPGRRSALWPTILSARTRSGCRTFQPDHAIRPTDHADASGPLWVVLTHWRPAGISTQASNFAPQGPVKRLDLAIHTATGGGGRQAGPLQDAEVRMWKRAESQGIVGYGEPLAGGAPTAMQRFHWPALTLSDDYTGLESKTGARVAIPVGEPLKVALDEAAKRKRSTVILTNSTGNAWPEHGFRSSWRKACAKAGVEG